MRWGEILRELFWFSWPDGTPRQWLMAMGVFSTLVLGLYLTFSWLGWS